MKKLIVILIVLFASSVVFAGNTHWWFRISSVYKGKPVAVMVCACSEFDAGVRANAAGLCGPSPTSRPWPAEYAKCVKLLDGYYTNQLCTP